MANFTKIPFLTPIKFVPATATPGKNFDDDWAYNQIKRWENKACFKQKWQFGDETKLQVTSTILPDKLKVYNKAGQIVNDFEWIPIAVSGTTAGTVYELTLQLDTGIPGALPSGIYWLYQEVTNGGSYLAKFISEPIDLRAVHNNTSIIEYTNSENTQDVYFGATEIIYNARIEAQVCEFLPESETSDYIDQVHNAQILSATPFRNFKLLIGNAPGVADYIADLLNRIFCLDSVRINGKLFTKVSGAKWEPQRTKGYPLAGWAIDITETITLSSLEYNDVDPLLPGVVTAYDINESLYGGTTGTDLHIIDIEQT